MEAIKEKAPRTSTVNQKSKNQDGKIGGMQARFFLNSDQGSTQDTPSKLNPSVKNVSQNCAICRTEYLLVDFKSSRICDECVQYIKSNY